MALTKISTGGVKDDAVTAGKIPANAVGSSEIADDAVGAAQIADDGVAQAAVADEAIDEARLQISNAGTNGQFLSKQTGNAGGLTWATVTVPDSDKIEEGNTSIETVDTGSDGHVKITTEGTERVRVLANGNVGIGTNAPSWPLEVKGIVKHQATNSTNGFIAYTHTDNTYRLNYNGAGNDELVIKDTGAVAFSSTNYGSSGQVLTSQGASAAPSWSAVDTGGEVVRQAQYTSSSSYTVPSGVTTIRAYAVGAGGNGGIATAGNYHQTSGAGGGMAYGDFTVSPGQTVTITISNRVATVTYGGTVLLTGNPGAHATDMPSSLTYATAGTATKHSSVTNGGAYSGGAGGYINTGGSGPGGASAGSPAGAGGRANKGGGCGIGGGVYNAYPGGGAGSSSGIDYVSGGSGPDQNGRDGARYAFFIDPLIQGCVMPGSRNNTSISLAGARYYHGEAPTGVGGRYMRANSMGNGGSFAGGAGGSSNISSSVDHMGGDGGVLAGGGAAGGGTGGYIPGHGGYGGGGGAGKFESGGSSSRGNGGSAVVWIFHT